MGNHDVGRGMHAAAKGFWVGRGKQPEPTKEQALAFLDAVGEEWRGADAEFDDYLYPDQPLGRLIVIAFGPWTYQGKDADEGGDDYTPNDFWDAYRNEIEEPFSQRYDFC